MRIPYPKTMFGPGGQRKVVLSKEAEAKLGSGWNTNNAVVNPVTDYPKALFNGKDRVVVGSEDEELALEGKWFESLKEAKAKPKPSLPPKSDEVTTETT